MVTFKQIMERNYGEGYTPSDNLVYIRIPNAEEVLWRGLQYFIGDNAEWLPCYDEVADWLSDNHGRGLLCYGACGLGKSVICRKIIPEILRCYHHKVVSLWEADSMNHDIDAVKANHILYIDDIGTEGESVRYGERRMAFPEIVDAAEKKGKLLMCSTNLSLKELREKYAERTTDRLRAITKQVLFKGESFRR